jgi:glycosyltransferase involved in cell wall biosynthesis
MTIRNNLDPWQCKEATKSKRGLSVVIPARNEAAGLRTILPKIIDLLGDSEIVVVDDGSTDDTVSVCAEFKVKTVNHPYPMGNGAAIKSGTRVANGEIIVFMDADGQHRPEDILRLLEKLEQGYDMVVGARSSGSQANAYRGLANRLYNKLGSWMVGQKILDLTSGFRAVNAEKFRQFMYLLPNGFSYPTTITMSFFRAGYAVSYVPINAPKRIGTSHMRLARDGVRFLLIIFKIGTLYSPLKLFFPVSMSFLVTGLVYSAFTILSLHRFTNMSTLLFIMAILVFLIGLLSEQITMLIYKDTDTK